MTTTASETGVPTGAPVSRPCARCKINPRDRAKSSYCQDCRNAHAAEYRERHRPRETFEERVCELDGCERTFTWRSTHAKQKYCCRGHYMIVLNLAKRRVEEALPEGLKRCRKCGQVRTAEWYSPSQWAERSGRCRDCWREYAKARSAEDLARHSAASRRCRARKLLRQYGAYTDDIDQIEADQGGVCASCCGPAGAKNFQIDHDHALEAAGLPCFRGLLCGRCNIAIGLLDEDPDKLKAALEYLLHGGYAPKAQASKDSLAT